MMRLSVIVGIGFATALAVGAFGCDGGNDGNSCTSQSDCSDGLVCQPIPNRSSDYCCPSPLVNADGEFMSKNDTCRPGPAPAPAPSSSK